jgi:hypothetical protein
LSEHTRRKLSDDELRAAKHGIGIARDRIRNLGGDSSPSAIDRHGAGDRGEWAKRLLKYLTGAKGCETWSCNDALQLGEALQRCEIERVTKRLCEAYGGVTEGELRRMYDTRRNAAIAETGKPTREADGGVQTAQGGAIPVEYHNWIASHADDATLSILQEMKRLLLFGQVISATKFEEVPTFAMLYEPHVVPTIAAQLARYLIRENVVPKARYKSAFDALEKVFAERRDACRQSFWTHFRRYDVKAVEEIERQIKALDIEGIGVRDAAPRVR